MCPWVRPHAPSLGRQRWGLPSSVEYFSPQGVFLPLVYGTTSLPLWLELRGLSAWLATPSWTVYRLACQQLLPWLRVTFAVVPDAAWPGSKGWLWGTAPPAGPVGWLGRRSAPDPWGLGSLLSLGRPPSARVCGILGRLAPVHRCARSMCCFAWAVSWATWLLLTIVPARCVALRVRCPGPLGSCSPVRPLGLLCCACGVLSHLAPVHRRACSVCCFACAVSEATWLLFPAVPARCVALCVWCPGQLGSCSLVCPRGLLCCMCGALGKLATVHRCARWAHFFACAVSCATWLLCTGVLARCVALRVRCPWPLGSCLPVCPLGALLCVCGVLGHLAPVHRCARSVCCVALLVYLATWLLFTGVPAWFVLLGVRCHGLLGSCSPVCPLAALLCVCGVLGHLAPVHRCARVVCCNACAVSWTTWPLFTGVPARCVALCVRCPGPLGSCSPVSPLGALLCVCVVFGHMAPVHRCARSVCFVACAVAWATWLLFTGVPALCVVLLVRCPGPIGSCSSCARFLQCFVCAVSWATPLLFTVVPAQCVVLRVRYPGPLGSCSPMRSPGGLRGVLGYLVPVPRCSRSV